MNKNAIAVEIREPFPAWAWPLAWTWIAPYRAVAMDDRAPQDQAGFVEYQMSLKGWRTWGVWRDGELGGVIRFEPAPHGVWVIHIALKTTFFGAGFPASAQAIEQIFTESTGHVPGRKVMGMVLASNLPAAALARSIGTEEAHLRGQVMVNGAPADVLMFGLLREEWHGGHSIVAGRRSGVGSGQPDADEHHVDHVGIRNVDGDDERDHNGEHVLDVQPEPDRPAEQPVPIADVGTVRRGGRSNQRRDGGVRKRTAGRDQGPAA